MWHRALKMIMTGEVIQDLKDRIKESLMEHALQIHIEAVSALMAHFCQAQVQSPKVQSPKVKTKGT